MYHNKAKSVENSREQLLDLIRTVPQRPSETRPSDRPRGAPRRSRRLLYRTGSGSGYPISFCSYPHNSTRDKRHMMLYEERHTS